MSQGQTLLLTFPLLPCRKVRETDHDRDLSPLVTGGEDCRWATLVIFCDVCASKFTQIEKWEQWAKAWVQFLLSFLVNLFAAVLFVLVINHMVWGLAVLGHGVYIMTTRTKSTVEVLAL